MTAGFQAIGDSSQLIISEDNPVAMLMGSGTYARVGSSETVITYSTPINSPIPPMVFVKPDGAHMVTMFRHIGSAGNWTGFGIQIYTDAGFSNIVASGSWKVAAYYVPDSGNSGLRIYDGSGRLIFNSDIPPVKFLGGSQTWAHASHNGSYLGNFTTDTWVASYITNSYFLVSQCTAQFLGAGNGTTPSATGMGFLNAGASTSTQIFFFYKGFPAGLPVATSTVYWPLVLIE